MMTMQPFDDVVQLHGTTVLRVCASILGPGPDAEDAWAETFLAALRAHPLPPDVVVEAWLVRVARNKAVDVLRARHREHVSEPDALHGVTDDALRPTEFDDELWAQVAQLSDRQRFVVAHRYIAQWSYPEIAEKLGCSPAAARRTGADAIAALRRLRTSDEESNR